LVLLSFLEQNIERIRLARKPSWFWEVVMHIHMTPLYYICVTNYTNIILQETKFTTLFVCILKLNAFSQSHQYIITNLYFLRWN
jgi:hypothetical protein